MKKKNINDEIDLIDLLFVIWNKKFIISFFVFIPIIFTYIYNVTLSKKESQIYSVKSEILPISTLEENKYNSYIAFLQNYKPLYLPLGFESKNKNKNAEETLSKNIITTLQNIEPKGFHPNYDAKDNLIVLSLNKKSLFNYFNEILSQKSKLTEYLKEFGYIDKNDYLNITEFETLIYRIALSIQISTSMKNENKLDPKMNPLKTSFIEFQTDDLQKWEDFLKFLEKKINLEIQKNINQMFQSYIVSVEKVNRYYMEDINILKSSNLISEKDYLKAEQNIANLINYIKRIKYEYDKIPVSSEDFYAGKIAHELVRFNYKIISKPNKNNMIILSGIIGLIIGLFTIFLSHAIKIRR